MAFEVARSLQKSGGNIDLVLLIDARAFAWTGIRKIATVWKTVFLVSRELVFRTRKDISFWKRTSEVFVKSLRFLKWQISSIPTAIHYRFEVFRHKKTNSSARQQINDRPSGYFDSEGKPIDMWIVYRLAQLVGQNWRPECVDAKGALIRAKSDVDMLPGYDRAHGWSNLFAQGFELLQSDGDHLSILTDDHADSLSALINSVLDRLDAERNCSSQSKARDCSSAEAVTHRPSNHNPSYTRDADGVSVYQPQSNDAHNVVDNVRSIERQPTEKSMIIGDYGLAERQ